MKNPSAAPASSSSILRLRKARGREAAMSKAATEKRIARNMKTEEWSRAFLTTTKVAPQRSVQAASAKSACSRLEFSGGDREVSVVRLRRQLIGAARRTQW